MRVAPQILCLLSVTPLVGCASDDPIPPPAACQAIDLSALTPCGAAGGIVTLPFQQGQLDGCTWLRGGAHVPDPVAADALAPLSGLIRIDESLTLFRGAPFADLAALASLREVGGALSVRLTMGVARLDGLDAVCEVGQLRLAGNDDLEDLTGLRGLTRVRGDVEITDNRRLSVDAVAWLLDRIVVDGDVVVAGNGG